MRPINTCDVQDFINLPLLFRPLSPVNVIEEWQCGLWFTQVD